MGFCVGGGRFIRCKSVNYRLPPSKRFGIWRISLALLYIRGVFCSFFCGCYLSPKPVFLETISIAMWEIYISRDHLTDINWSHSRIKHCYNVWWIFWEICQKSSRTTVWLRISPWPPDLAACIFVGGSLNGGTQQPWVFLLKMIILGCLGGTTIEWNTHIWATVRIKGK